jgi:ABC-type antimicrobial peptide transport system ATPase subunit
VLAGPPADRQGEHLPVGPSNGPSAPYAQMRMVG